MPCYLFKKYRFSVKNLKANSKFEKAFHKFVEFVETNLLIYNRLQFDQYSGLAILLNSYISVFGHNF